MSVRQSIPVIDVSSLSAGAESSEVPAQIGEACREHGFFYVVGHGVDCGLQESLEKLSREFFALPESVKSSIDMARAGRAWRGYFPVGAELTSGLPDQKEGIYFGQELNEEHPLVAAGKPLHGANLFPDEVPRLKEVVLEYMEALTDLGHTLMRGIALSLGLSGSYFHERYTADPLTLFRIFNYPPLPPGENELLWSVGEHTDYGILTILKQDQSGGLEIKSRSRWIPAPPLEGSFICNIGDMLDRMTGGIYRSTPHRVRNQAERGRLSFPFFFDPSFDSIVRPIDPGMIAPDDRNERWDGASVHEFGGTYGEYIMAKVSRVFPQLSGEAL